MLAETTDLRRPVILVVDDEGANRRLLEAILAPQGYQIVEARDGEEALRILERQPVDLVLLDVLMPHLDGYETCRRIRSEMSKLTLPILFVTASGDREARVRSRDAGADDFLMKPIDDLELSLRVRSLLRIQDYHRVMDQLREQMARELETLRLQVGRADRLTNVGNIAAEVGHDLSNVAMVIDSVVPMIAEDAERGVPPDAEVIEELARACEQLKAYARKLQGIGRDRAARLTIAPPS